MRKRDKLKNIEKANLLAEERYLESKGVEPNYEELIKEAENLEGTLYLKGIDDKNYKKQEEIQYSSNYRDIRIHGVIYGIWKFPNGITVKFKDFPGMRKDGIATSSLSDFYFDIFYKGKDILDKLSEKTINDVKDWVLTLMFNERNTTMADIWPKRPR